MMLVMMMMLFLLCSWGGRGKLQLFPGKSNKPIHFHFRVIVDEEVVTTAGTIIGPQGGVEGRRRRIGKLNPRLFLGAEMPRVVVVV